MMWIFREVISTFILARSSLCKILQDKSESKCINGIRSPHTFWRWNGFSEVFSMLPNEQPSGKVSAIFQREIRWPFECLGCLTIKWNQSLIALLKEFQLIPSAEPLLHYYYEFSRCLDSIFIVKNVLSVMFSMSIWGYYSAFIWGFKNRGYIKQVSLQVLPRVPI